jgi:hypothetical protein
MPYVAGLLLLLLGGCFGDGKSVTIVNIEGDRLAPAPSSNRLSTWMVDALDDDACRPERPTLRRRSAPRRR